MPTQKRIFDKLPPMSSVEDDLFPIDPMQAVDPDGTDPGQKSHGGRPEKRQRMAQALGMHDNAEHESWRREYSTTMEQSSDFTMASLPGFVSAGAHKSALDA